MLPVTPNNEKKVTQSLTFSGKKSKNSVLKLSSFFQLTELLFAEIPRVRLDKVVRRLPPKPFWEAPPTLEEEPEDGSADISTVSESMVPNTALQSITGRLKLIIVVY